MRRRTGAATNLNRQQIPQRPGILGRGDGGLLGLHVLLFYDRDVLSDIGRYDHRAVDAPCHPPACDLVVCLCLDHLGFYGECDGQRALVTARSSADRTDVGRYAHDKPGFSQKPGLSRQRSEDRTAPLATNSNRRQHRSWPHVAHERIQPGSQRRSAQQPRTQHVRLFAHPLPLLPRT